MQKKLCVECRDAYIYDGELCDDCQNIEGSPLNKIHAHLNTAIYRHTLDIAKLQNEIQQNVLKRAPSTKGAQNTVIVSRYAEDIAYKTKLIKELEMLGDLIYSVQRRRKPLETLVKAQ